MGEGEREIGERGFERRGGGESEGVCERVGGGGGEREWGEV